MTTRTTGPENATEDMKEDESSSSYVSMDIFKGKEKKEIDVNGNDNDNNNVNRRTNYLSSPIKNKKGKKNINRRGRGGVNKRQEIGSYNK